MGAYHSTAFEYAKEITLAAIAAGNTFASSANDVAYYFETIFNKLDEIETNSKKIKPI